MLKKFVVLLACISTLFIGFIFLVSPNDRSIALKRETASNFYNLGLDQPARAVWKFSAWAGDRGAQANLALLDYRASYLEQLRDDDYQEGTWQKSYDRVDQILDSISSEKDVHEFNRAMLRISWPLNIEWQQSGIKRLRFAETNGNDLAKKVLRVFAKNNDYKELLKALADNGDVIAAYYFADEMALEHENNIFLRYRDIALTGQAKYLPGYELFTRRLHSFDNTKIEMFKKYSKDGYIGADVNLFEIYNNKYFENCRYIERTTCEIELQKQMNLILRNIARHDCSSQFTRPRIDSSGLITLNVDEGKIINSCKHHQKIAAIQLASRLYLGLGEPKDQAEARAILQRRSLIKIPYAQMILGQISGDKSKVIEENGKLDFIFAFHADNKVELKHLADTGSIRMVTFNDFDKWATSFNDEDVAQLWPINEEFNRNLGMTWIAENMESNSENILGKTGVTYIVEDSPKIQEISKKWPGRLIILRPKPIKDGAVNTQVAP